MKVGKGHVCSLYYSYWHFQIVFLQTEGGQYKRAPHSIVIVTLVQDGPEEARRCWGLLRTPPSWRPHTFLYWTEIMEEKHPTRGVQKCKRHHRRPVWKRICWCGCLPFRLSILRGPGRGSGLLLLSPCARHRPRAGIGRGGGIQCLGFCVAMFVQFSHRGVFVSDDSPFYFWKFPLVLFPIHWLWILGSYSSMRILHSYFISLL